MRAQHWNIAYATAIGTSHQKLGTKCQDASACKIITSKTGKEILLAAASDGAGSVSKSDIGSNLTVNLFIKEFEAALEESSCISDFSREFIIGLLDKTRREIQKHADDSNSAMKEYSCTVLGAVVWCERALFFQIGDGAIVIENNSEQKLVSVFWPQHGEYINQTNFLTQDNWQAILEFKSYEEKIDRIALFTDGIERLVLDYSSSSVHSPAFTPIYDWLEQSSLNNEESQSSAISAFLQSDHVNDRTDDDKTLIIASRSIPSR